MSLWIDHLASSSQASDDFLTWFGRVEANIMRQIAKASSEHDTAKVISLGLEYSLYNKISDTFRAEIREKQAQNGRKQ